MTTIFGGLPLRLLPFLLIQLCMSTGVTPFTLCHEWTSLTKLININMDTSPIVRTEGFCSCRISTDAFLQLQIFFPEVISPSCKTNIYMSDNYIFSCVNYHIQPESHSLVLSPGQPILVYVHSSGSSEAMSGTAQFKSDKEFVLQCYRPNMTSPSPVTPSSTETQSVGRKSGTTLPPTKETLKEEPKRDFPVVLTVGCAAGSLLVIGLIVVVFICWRKKRKKPFTLSKANEGHKDEFLSMENVLYSSSGDLTDGPQLYSNDISKDPDDYSVPTTSAAREEAPDMGDKNNRIAATNGDLYTLVDKSGKIQDTQVDHTTAPSGDVYTVVSKVK